MPALVRRVCSIVRVPRYLINSTVTIDNADAVGPAAIRGDGPSTVLLWTSDSDLFVFQTTSDSAQVGSSTGTVPWFVVSNVLTTAGVGVD